MRSTAKNAGWLDLKMVPERHNAVKVRLFLDAGGSMDDHVQVCEELFSAARTYFKHLEYFYFHNFVYESVWKDNRRRHTERTPLAEVMRTYGHDYKLVVVGDATMSPYEIVQPGGSIEHWNEEAGAVWMKRLLANYPHDVWLNPEPRERWQYTPSVQITRELFEERMFPLTLEGLDRAMRELQLPFGPGPPFPHLARIRVARKADLLEAEALQDAGRRILFRQREGRDDDTGQAPARDGHEPGGPTNAPPPTVQPAATAT